MRFALPVLLAVSACCAALPAQTTNRFAAYEHCKFVDDLSLAETTALPSGVLGRTVKTVMGPRQVPLAGGRTLVFAYPQTEPFATVKVEQIPAADYAQARQDLVANFEQILTGDDSSTRDDTLKPRLNGLEIYGLNRKQLEGGVLGIYLFFVDRTHSVATIYFLNQDPTVRAFSNLDEYAGLRDNFLSAYTACAAGHPPSPTAPIRTPIAAAPAPQVATVPAAGTPETSLPDAPAPTPPGTPAALVSGTSAPEVPATAAPGAATAPAHLAAKASSRKVPALRRGSKTAAKRSTEKRSGTKAKASAKRTVRTKKKK